MAFSRVSRSVPGRGMASIMNMEAFADICEQETLDAS